MEKGPNIQTNVSLLSVKPEISPINPQQSANSVQLELACSSSDDLLHTCRICRDETVHEALISPCYCAGSLGRCHVLCLEEWLSKANKNSCEICGYKYHTVRRPKTFKEWFTACRTRRERRYFWGDLICFCFLTPLVVASSYLCAQGAWYYLILKHAWTGAGLIILTAFLWVIFGFWLIMTVRFHKRCWIDWRERNFVVRIVNVDRVKEEESGSEGSTEMLETPV